MPISSADTRFRRTEARATLNAIEAFDNTLTDTERIILHVAQTILAREPANAPLTSEQRAALFAAFSNVFGHSDQAQRLAFTGMVLGKDPQTVPISWSSTKPGALTSAEASKVLDALDALDV